MKQLETPIGIYMGKELEVYYKKIGDGSDPKLIMTLHFNANDENGDSFISLFAEPNFSIENLTEYFKEYEVKTAFEEKVKEVVSELNQFLEIHFKKYGEDVVERALATVKSKNTSSCGGNVTKNVSPVQTLNEFRPKGRTTNKRRSNQGVAQRYAYNLIKQIIEKNPTFGFQQVYDIFGYKNYIEDIKNVKSECRWCMDDDDVITLADNTRVVVSNQWGFNNNCKRKMNFLRQIASRYGIDISLP